MPWAVVAYPKRFRRPLWARIIGGNVEVVPRSGYVAHRYRTEHEARVMAVDLQRYWPRCRLKVEHRA